MTDLVLQHSGTTAFDDDLDDDDPYGDLRQYDPDDFEQLVLRDEGQIPHPNGARGQNGIIQGMGDLDLWSSSSDNNFDPNEEDLLIGVPPPQSGVRSSRPTSAAPMKRFMPVN